MAYRKTNGVEKSMKRFSFKASVTKVDWELLQHIIPIPSDIVEQLPAGRLRCKVKINNTETNLALQYRKTGERFLSMSGLLMRQAKVKSGEMVNVSFVLVDKDLVELPEELEAVLDQDDDAMKLWKTFSPAWQRGFAHYVNSAKKVDSRIKRAIEIMEKAKRGQLNAQIEQRKKEELKNSKS